MPTLNVFCLHVLSFLVLERSCKGKKIYYEDFKICVNLLRANSGMITNRICEAELDF